MSDGVLSPAEKRRYLYHDAAVDRLLCGGAEILRTGRGAFRHRRLSPADFVINRFPASVAAGRGIGAGQKGMIFICKVSSLSRSRFWVCWPIGFCETVCGWNRASISRTGFIRRKTASGRRTGRAGSSWRRPGFWRIPTGSPPSCGKSSRACTPASTKRAIWARSCPTGNSTSSSFPVITGCCARCWNIAG